MSKIFGTDYHLKNLCLLFLILMMLGCTASTNFIPPTNNHKAYLGMKEGEFTLIKDSVVQKISEKPADMLLGSDVAQATAAKSTETYNSGQSQMMGGAFLNIFLPIIALPMTIGGISTTHTGIAQFIDAINIYNDQSDSVLNKEQAGEVKSFPTSVKILYNGTKTILNKEVLLKCTKKRESIFFSTITLSFEKVIGVDKKLDGPFKRTSLNVEKGDVFYVKTESMLLHVEVVEQSDEGLTLTFNKQ
jgi:hypothetical protein